MKNIFVLALLSLSISAFAISVKVEDCKYKMYDHTDDQTYICTACDTLIFLLNSGSVTPNDSTEEIKFNFQLTDMAGEYDGGVEYYFGQNVYLDGKRYGMKGDFWIAFDVVYPLSSKNEVCFLHSYTINYNSKKTESLEPETYTELVFVGKDTQKKRITYIFKDPDKYVYNQVYDYISNGLMPNIFKSGNLDDIPKCQFLFHCLVVMNRPVERLVK